MNIERGEEMKNIEMQNWTIKAVNLWMDKWLVLAVGDSEKYNAMTIGWGSVGVMWKKPFVQIVVRPTRYTFEFMERYETFTVSSFPERYRDALKLLGSQSGRESDKIAASGLTIRESRIVKAPTFNEADMVLECRKMYWQDMDPDHFLMDEIDENYSKKDYHRIYFGEILNISMAE